MKPSPAVVRALLRVLVGAATAVAVVGATAPAVGAQEAPDVDRTDDELVEVSARTDRAQDRLRQKLGGSAVIDNDLATGTARIVARLDGFLTSPSSEAPQAIALGYLRDHAAAFGIEPRDVAELRLSSLDRGPDGTVHLSWEQRSDGIPNVDGGVHAAVTTEGRLINVRGSVLSGGDAESGEPLVGPAVAYAAAVPYAAPVPPPAVSASADRQAHFAGGGSGSLVTYQDEGVERLGWQLLVPGGPAAFYHALVDARTGRLQRRTNLVRSASSISHFNVNPLSEGGVTSVDELPEAWLAPEAETFDGTYVHAVSDVDDTITNHDVIASGPPYVLPPPDPTDEVQLVDENGDSHWDFAPVFGFEDDCDISWMCSWGTGDDRIANREFSTAQLFWYVNTFRDHLADTPVGFTGVNGSGFEAGADRVLAQSLDGALTGSRNNAFMLTLPDGQGALMQVRLFRIPIDSPDPKRYDGAHDAGLVYHEYAHALTDRLTADNQGISTMDGAQPSAMAEAISDYYALDFLAESQPVEVPDTAAPGEVMFGSWLGQLRTEAIDCAVGDTAPACPGAGAAGAGGYDYDDFGRIGDGSSPHDDGEIWGQTLWSLRAALIARYGSTEGITRMRAYLTDGIRLAPEFPTFLDMRNAILQAAVSRHGDADATTIWEIFAGRGMGWSAATTDPDDENPSAAFDRPPSAATGDATAVQETTVTLNGQLDPNGAATGYVFQIGETSNYGAATVVVDAGSGEEPVAVEQTIAGLRAGTTYHYRVVAVRGSKQLPGGDRTFATHPAPTNPNPPVSPNPPVVRPTLLLDSKLKAKRKGTFKIRVFFGDAAPAGSARFTVIKGRKRYARATTPVRIGGNVTKTLKLTKKARRAIRPGKSKRVTLELRLPNGQKVKKTLRLVRSRR